MKQPCDEAVIRSDVDGTPCREQARPWVLAATILGSSMAFIDSTVVNVALPALQSSFHATVVDVQWVVEAYGERIDAYVYIVQLPVLTLQHKRQDMKSSSGVGYGVLRDAVDALEVLMDSGVRKRKS